MNIKINNVSEIFELKQLTVSDLIRIKGYSKNMVVVKINDVIVTRESYDICNILDGDSVLILFLVSGG